MKITQATNAESSVVSVTPTPLLISYPALCYVERMTPSDFVETLSPAFDVREHRTHFELVCRTCRRRWMTQRETVARPDFSAARLLAHARREQAHQLV